jgi:hexosaminidase
MLITLFVSLGVFFTASCTLSEEKITKPKVMGFDTLIPRPKLMQQQDGLFELNQNTKIIYTKNIDKVKDVAEFLAYKLRPATGYAVSVLDNSSDKHGNNIHLELNQDQHLAKEGYELTITESNIHLSAYQPEGLFRGIQTIRQLLPASMESNAKKIGPWFIATGKISDEPRFSYRGYMLDVSRHFFTVDEVKKLIDHMALYKMNAFHLHLTDDQGWRIEIPNWPKLTTVGSRSQVNQTDCKNCFYTLKEFEDIVAYADERFIQLIPEIDSPGHIRAAQASYPNELYCDGDEPNWPYTGKEVKISSLCFSNPKIYEFFEDVVAEIAPRINSPYIHIGGDETPDWVAHKDYSTFLINAKRILSKYNKTLIGWTSDIGSVSLGSDVVGQHWESEKLTQSMADQGAKIIVSPADKIYLDIKYNKDTKLGYDWAGHNSIEDAYTWDPAEIVNEKHILGIEAPLWAETLNNINDAEYLTFPRLLGVAELGWSQQEHRQWPEYKSRLATHGDRLKAMGINFFASPHVSWSTGPLTE